MWGLHVPFESSYNCTGTKKTRLFFFLDTFLQNFLGLRALSVCQLPFSQITLLICITIQFNVDTRQFRAILSFLPEIASHSSSVSLQCKYKILSVKRAIIFMGQYMCAVKNLNFLGHHSVHKCKPADDGSSSCKQTFSNYGSFDILPSSAHLQHGNTFNQQVFEYWPKQYA